MIKRKATTISKKVTFSGIGIHTGEVVRMDFKPAPLGSGIYFTRSDLPGTPPLKACVKNVVDTSRSTTIGNSAYHIHTVEHVLAAVRAAGIDHMVIELSNLEPPVGNGSSDLFVEMLEEAGKVELEGDVLIYKVTEPLYVEDNEISLIVLPYDGYKISYTLSYPNVPSLDGQFHSLDVSRESFKNEIASCRTFTLYKEIEALLDRGLIKGGSLANAVVVTDGAILSKGGLVFPNEMARHKILDIIGDLSLIDPFEGHIISIRSGHATNVALAKELQKVFHA
ncbi:UDP-3-O-acyl-N-acetylglucosamine deacetylase [Chlamydiales bacterium]|nr:UDP-3-O-acyl-N-acetylglucosamine deacetylase [Chlamydiales bacterium]